MSFNIGRCVSLTSGLILNLVIGLSLNILGLNSHAAIPKKIKLNSSYATGGEAGSGFSLLNFKSIKSPNSKTERFAFEIGDQDGNKKSGKPGYYHMEYIANKNMISLDFAQMAKTRIDNTNLKKVLAKSKNVKSFKFSHDPEDGSLHLTLVLKSPVKSKVYQVKGVKDTSKVVLDLTTL